MAVSFNVPKSPKRDIFVIDNFMGVDLTNSGANVEDVRSPYAPNMVRYVPGKVRKRTGYQTQVQFTTPTNVNRALGTSDTDVIFEISAWIPDAPVLYTTLYDLSRTFNVGETLYFEFDYKAESRFYLTGKRAWISASEDWSHYSGSQTLEYVTSQIKAVGDPNGAAEQTIHIKNFSVMTATNSSYEYKVAPPYYVETETNDPIYGCHVLKSGTFDGNRVVNVNRVLGTTSNYDTFILDDSTSFEQLYALNECIWVKGSDRMKVTVNFDYILTGDAVELSIAGYSSTATRITAASEETHKTITTYAGSYTAKNVRAKTTGNSVLQIKNLSVCYQTDDNYTWSVAPEDNGGTFHTEDIYYVSRKNYAEVDEFHKTQGGEDLEQTMSCQIVDPSNPNLADIKGFCHVSFDLHTSSDGNLSSIRVDVVNDQNQYLEYKTFNNHLYNEHFDYYISAASAEYFVKRISVKFTNTAANTRVSADITNIKVNAISPREVFDVSSKYYIYHVGTDFYLRASNSKGFTKIFTGANNHISQSWQLDKTLFILDGKGIYSYNYGDNEVSTLGSEDAYIPLVTIAKSPKGGGNAYEPLNMLQPGFYEQFVVTADEADETQFHLSFAGLDATTTKAWLLDENGNWVQKTENTDYSVNRGTGVVTFNTAPGASPLKGSDNVKILAYRTVAGYRDRVTKCTIGTLFGVGGAADRIFVSGNPDYPNWDFYSERYDATYFPDTGYSALGSSSSAIVGYAIVNSYLATFKDEYDSSQSVFIREGDMLRNEDTGVSDPVFRLINTLQGNGVIAPYAFGYLQTEPLFLTRAGIYAITAQDITGEKYGQNRSFYLNGKLLKEANLENATAAVYNDMYVLALNNQLYILDGLQPTRTDRSEPYATRQYVGFYCKDVPALCLWVDNNALWFGSNDGHVCRFATDIESLDSYNDDGKAISSWWETPDLDGKLFYKNKTFRYFAIRLMKALRTSVKLYSQKLGSWTFIKEDISSGVVFDFNNIDFELFSFSTDSSEKVVHTKLRVKKVDKARFKVENSNKNEPFGLFDLALEYVESGNYKR